MGSLPNIGQHNIQSLEFKDNRWKSTVLVAKDVYKKFRTLT